MKRLITGIVTLTTLAVGFWGCNDLSRTLFTKDTKEKEML